MTRSPDDAKPAGGVLLADRLPEFGSQEPRILTRPEFDHERPGEECLELCAAAGVYLDPWQQLLVRVILAVKMQQHRERWAALRAAILVARQNGKGEVLLALTLYWMFLSDPKHTKLIVHTAHEFKTSAEAFLRLKAVIDANDWMGRRVLKVATSHGEEGYSLRNGQRLRFLARSLNSGRGFTGDRVILDEAQQLSQFAMGALMPTMSARNKFGMGVQMVYAGTVPSERNDSAHWTDTMQKGRKGSSKRLVWAEFNKAEKVPPAAERDPAHPWWVEAVVEGNPSLGYRHDWDWIEEERESLSYADYVRERLNIWSSDPPGMVIPLSTWEALAWPESRMVGRRCIAIDAPPGLGSAVICAMGRNQHGQWHGEVIETHRQTDWLAVRVAEVVRKNEDVAAVVVDPGSPAGALIAGIEAEGVEVTRVTIQQHAAACGMLYTRATQPMVDEETDEPVADPVDPSLPKRQLVHLGDPILSDALKAATKRPGPDGAWLWNRRDSGANISPLVALTLAGYGLSTLPEEDVEPWGFWS